VSTSALAQANALSDRDRIIAGRRLTIPGQRTAAPAGGGGHLVRPGDTLSHLAARWGVTVRAVAEANGLTDVHLVRSGTTLRIPSAGVSTASGAVASVAPVVAGRPNLPERLRSSPSRLALVPRFQHWAATYGVPADLLMAMTWLESGWQNHVVSPVGAVGIGQLMPDTTEFVSGHLLRTPLDPTRPDDNIRMSARYLRWLLDRSGGDMRLALAGYYQGPASVRQRGLFPVTEQYVAAVTSLRTRSFAGN
jgi:N-acetylmuramoyl-L-alanine amidase